MHVGAAVLDAEEGRVEGGESFVVSVPWHLCPLCRNPHAGVHDPYTSDRSAGKTCDDAFSPSSRHANERSSTARPPSQACFATDRKLLPMRTSGASRSEPGPRRKPVPFSGRHGMIACPTVAGRSSTASTRAPSMPCRPGADSSRRSRGRAVGRAESGSAWRPGCVAMCPQRIAAILIRGDGRRARI